ncbi:MAG: gamma-glutamylcyclotransferase family protein [Nanobdellota archaeon]
MEKYFVYGSLRSGEFNWKRLGLIPDNIVAKAYMKGALLYSLGAYPALYVNGNPNDVVVGEIQVYEPETEHKIDRMEREAGYIKSIGEAIDEQGTSHKVSFYCFDEKPEAEKVPSGDWFR